MSDLVQRRHNVVEKREEGRSTGVRVAEERENCERGDGGRKGQWRGSYRLQYSLSNPELVSPELSFTRKIPGKI